MTNPTSVIDSYDGAINPSLAGIQPSLQNLENEALAKYSLNVRNAAS